MHIAWQLRESVCDNSSCCAVCGIRVVAEARGQLVAGPWQRGCLSGGREAVVAEVGEEVVVEVLLMVQEVVALWLMRQPLSLAGVSKRFVLLLLPLQQELCYAATTATHTVIARYKYNPLTVMCYELVFSS